MHRDVVNALVNGDIHLAKSIIARDDEVNRLHFLLVRILRTIIQTPGLSEKLGVGPIECLDYRLVASLVEAIGDECVRLAMKVAELKGAKLAEDLRKELMNLHTICFEAHEDALKAFLIGDVNLAENVRAMREKVEKTFANIEKMAKNQSLDTVPHVLAVASIIRQIYEHSVDMADLAMPKKL
jgi:phosphate uptake regulator